MNSLACIAILSIYPPLVGFILSLFTKSRTLGQFLICALLSLAFIASLFLYIGGYSPTTLTLYPWLHIEGLSLDWGIRLDTLSIPLILLVNMISWFVHIYSLGYMRQDPHILHFMGYLSFFTWAMLMLICAPNLFQLFFGWEGVGVASYILIGYYNQRSRTNAAAFKAFLVNRISDMGLLLGMACIFYIFHTLEFDILFAKLSGLQSSNPLLTLAAFLCLWGALGKSAQIGFHTWLPDAMEAPTPVSALIHAATMVTAGIFLIVRLAPLYECVPLAKSIMLCIGFLTAFFAATVALVQNNMKRILAYSTCSQIGYMFIATGSAAYTAAIFHLVTHAFFKALLFLAAGSVIHALTGEQDCRRMGGLFKRMPIISSSMWVGGLSLIGVPLFSGFYSKELILTALLTAPNSLKTLIYVGSLLTIGLTTLYTLRLLFMVFHGPSHNPEPLHPIPLSMKFPLLGLAVFTLASGYGGLPLFTKDKPIVSVLSLVMILISSGIALYGRRITTLSSPGHRLLALHHFLLNKWYIDSFFERIFTKPVLTLGRILAYKGDTQLIDHYGPDGVARATLAISQYAKRLQTGYIYHYALTIIAGLVLMMTWCFWR